MKIARIRRWAVDFGFYNAIYVQIETEGGAVGEAEVAMRAPDPLGDGVAG